MTTLLLSNVHDVSHEALYFWTKAAFNVWPRSVQLAPKQNKAVIQILLAEKFG